MKKFMLVMLCTALLTACANNSYVTSETTVQTEKTEITVSYTETVQEITMTTDETTITESESVTEATTVTEQESEGGGDGLCGIMLEKRTEGETGFKYEYCFAKISDELTVDINDYTPDKAAINVCGGKIYETETDIIDSESGEVLVAGYINEENFYENRRQVYMFDVDENRFVYRTGGVECLPGFGVYDFASGAAADVKDSKDRIPFGVHDGKIYSVKSAWDGFGTDIYTTDTETLETVLLFAVDTEGVFSGCFLHHFMYNGEIFILAEVGYSDSVQKNARLFKLTSDGAELVYEYPKGHSSFFRTALDNESGTLYSAYAVHDIGSGVILVDLNEF